MGTTDSNGIYSPANGETGWSAAVDQNFALLSGAATSVYYFTKYLIAANGVTNTAFANAITAMMAAGGGTLVFPGGYTDFTGELTIDLTTIANTRGSVVLQGQGQDSTRLRWVSDPGTGHFGIHRTGVSADYHLEVRDLSLIGPDGDNTALVWGTMPVAADGINLGSRDCFERVGARGWRAGIKVVGDHNTLRRVKVNRCFYGLYWADPDNNYQVYDHSLYDVELQQSWWASVAIAPNSLIGNGLFDNVWFCNGAPYGIYFEKRNSRSVGPVAAGFGGLGFKGLWNCQFIGPKWEGAGNAFIWDANYAGGDTTNYRIIEKMDGRFTFHNLATTNGVNIFSITNPIDTYTTPSGWTYGLSIGQITDSKFWAISFVDADANGIESKWDVGWMSRNEFHGPNFPSETATDGSPGAPIITSTTPLNTANRANKLTHTRLVVGDREGGLYPCKGTVAQNDVVRLDLAVAPGGVNKYTGGATYIGIAAHAAASGDYLWVWREGSVIVGSTAGVSINDWLTPEESATGKVKTRGAAGDVVIGRATGGSIAAAGTGYIELFKPVPGAF